MKTYNSENLPLEHIVKSGRDVLHYEFVIRNTFAEPAKLKPVKSSDYWNDQESPTYNLDNHSIEHIVQTVNKYGIPATIDISFKPISSSYTPNSIKISILPLSIEYHQDEPGFIDDYIFFRSEEFAREKAEELKSQGVDLQSLEAQKIEVIKEQIRRTIIWQYLVTKRLPISSSQTANMLKWIEGLNIIDDHYDLRKIGADDIEFLKLSQIIPDELSGKFFPNSVYVESIENFSRKLQTIRLHNGMNTVFALETPGKHVIGLQIGRTPEEIEQIAQFDAAIAKNVVSQTHLENIIDRYKRIVPRPLTPPQPNGN